MPENNGNVRHELDLHKVEVSAKIKALETKDADIEKKVDAVSGNVKWGVIAVMGLVISSVVKTALQSF